MGVKEWRVWGLQQTPGEDQCLGMQLVSGEARPVEPGGILFISCFYFWLHSVWFKTYISSWSLGAGLGFESY